MKMSHFALGGLILLFGAGIYLTMKTEMDGRLDDLKAEAEQKFEKYERAQREQAALIAKNAEAAMASKNTGSGQPTAAAPPRLDPRKIAAAPAPHPEDILPSPPGKPASAAPSQPGESSVIANTPPLLPPTPEEVEARMQEKERNILNNPGVGTERMDLETGRITGAIPEGTQLTTMQSRVVALPAIARIKEVKESAGFVVLDRGQNSNLAKGDKFSVRRGTFILGPVTVSDTIYPTECVADVGQLIDGASLQKGDEIIKWVR
jgi:hypothetical protein